MALTVVKQFVRLERKTGQVLWRRLVTAEAIETLHEIGNPASSTPAVDGKRVYAYFGSHGLVGKK